MARLIQIIFAVIILLGLAAYFGSYNKAIVREVVKPISSPDSVSHELFNQVLQEFVTPDGLVDYERLLATSRAELDAYLMQLVHTNPENLSEKEALAFWINAYNAYTIDLILSHYPLKGILRTTLIPIPKFSLPWDIKFVVIGGKTYTLNQLEHEILRVKFDEPRMHFAIVCASMGCPPLRPEAFTSAMLESQLDDQIRLFLSQENKNFVSGDEIHLSQIFSWFAPDFQRHNTTVQQWLAPYYEGEVAEKLSRSEYKIVYTDYSWDLNRVPPAE